MLNTHLSDAAHSSHLNEGQDLSVPVPARVPGEPVPIQKRWKAFTQRASNEHRGQIPLRGIERSTWVELALAVANVPQSGISVPRYHAHKLL